MTNHDVAVVTGGARGIGRGIAEALAQGNHAVAIVDLDKAAAHQAAADLAQRTGQPVIAVSADITDRDDVQAAVAEVDATFGRVDVLVNNAGIVRDKRLVNMEQDDWDAVIATNLTSQYLTCRAVVPSMVARRYGRIVNISSRAWLGGFGQANYSAAKGGVVSLTRSLAIELARDGITVNAVAPGIIDTPMFQGLPDDAQERLRQSVPAQRIGTPEDVAGAVSFLAARTSSYITGQLIYVCGGRSLSSPSV